MQNSTGSCQPLDQANRLQYCHLLLLS